MNCETRLAGAQRYVLARPTRLERLTVIFQALLLAQISPGLAVADRRPIG